MNPATGAPMPQTSWAFLVSARDPLSSEEWDRLLRKYWKPVYKYIRLAWKKDPEEAQDLTQSYLAAFFEKSYPSQFDPARGRFRTFLRASLDNFLRNARRAEKTLKRGGDPATRTLPFDEVEKELESAVANEGTAPFEEEWLRCVLRNALDRLELSYEQEGRGVHFHVFRRYYVDEGRTTYRALASELGIKETDVTNVLHHARSRFRKFVEEEVRDTVEGHGNFEAEMRELLGE